MAYQIHQTAIEYLKKQQEKQQLLDIITMIEPEQTPLTAMAWNINTYQVSGVATATAWAGGANDWFTNWELETAVLVLPQSPNGGPKNAWTSPYALGVDLVGTFPEDIAPYVGLEAAFKKLEKEWGTASGSPDSMFVHPKQKAAVQSLGIPSLPFASVGTDLTLTVSTQLVDIAKGTVDFSAPILTKPKVIEKPFLLTLLKKFGIG